MRKATKLFASLTGVVAGLAGLEHGIFELLQKGSKAANLMFSSIGTPCDPAAAWNACEPAMSVIPDFLAMGIVTLLIGSLIIFCSLFLINLKNGGWILILLSILLLLFGGGFFPPMIGIVCGIVALFISKPIKQIKNTFFVRLSGQLWPWTFVYFLFWSFAQFILGHFFNDFIKANMMWLTSIYMGMLMLSIVAANGNDKLQKITSINKVDRSL